jgi:hypothetical protein
MQGSHLTHQAKYKETPSFTLGYLEKYSENLENVIKETQTVNYTKTFSAVHLILKLSLE